MSSFLKRFGLFVLTLSLCPTLIRFCTPCGFYLGLLVLDTFDDTRSLFVAQRFEDRGQKIVLLVTDMPLKNFAQLGYFRSKFLAVNRQRFKLIKQLPCFSIVIHCFRNERLCSLVHFQCGEQVLFLELAK